MSHDIHAANGVNLHVEDVGEGTPVVLLHGWPVNHRMYEYQINELVRLGYRAIGVDLRGYGQSDKPATGYDYDTMSDDVHAVIEGLNLRDAMLVGFSMGGAIAVRYMARHNGDRVAKLVLAGAAAPAFTQREGFPYGLESSAVNDLITAAKSDRPSMLGDFGGLFFSATQDLSDEFAEWFNGLALDAGGHSTIASLEALRDEDLREDVGRISVPTAIFHGVNDQICPFDLAEQLDQGIENSTLVRFESSGHSLFVDEMEKFNNELGDFLSR